MLTASRLPNNMCKVSASGAATAARMSTGADAAAAYAHPISDSADTRRGRWTSPNPSAAATAATIDRSRGPVEDFGRRGAHGGGICQDEPEEDDPSDHEVDAR